MTGKENRNVRKAQSAMEYLMTYGWAILIIAVVLAALFSLGVFNQGALLGTSCIGSPGYLCQSPTLAGSSGTYLTFTLGQNTGSTVYNAVLMCVATANSLSSGSGISASPATFNTFISSGAVTGASWTPAVTDTSNGIALSSGQQFTISGLPCYPQTGSYTATVPIGTSFTGVIWMAYSTSANGNTQYAKIGTFSARTSS